MPINNTVRRWVQDANAAAEAGDAAVNTPQKHGDDDDDWENMIRKKREGRLEELENNKSLGETLWGLCCCCMHIPPKEQLMFKLVKDSSSASQQVSMIQAVYLLHFDVCSLATYKHLDPHENIQSYSRPG